MSAASPIDLGDICPASYEAWLNFTTYRGAYVAPQKQSPICEEGALTVRKAADFSGLSRTRLYELMGCGEMPYISVGHCRRIPKRALVTFLEQHVRRDKPKGGDRMTLTEKQAEFLREIVDLETLPVFGGHDGDCEVDFETLNELIAVGAVREDSITGDSSWSMRCYVMTDAGKAMLASHGITT